jgi:hypothetical protein
VAPQVVGWRRRHRARIELFFLPGYSPALNPDERLNQDLKSHAGGKPSKSQAQMTQALRARLGCTPRPSAKLRYSFPKQAVA